MGRPEDQVEGGAGAPADVVEEVYTDDAPVDTRKVEVQLSLAEVIKINPQAGEVLFFKFKGDEFYNDDVNEMGFQLRKLFPYNKVIVMALPEGHDVELTSIAPTDTVIGTSTEPGQATSACAEPASYCNDCGCGKKERIEGKKS